ncbi:MAG: YbjN domain-containing protein [Jatrophihabitans sp.]|uniref:YbjN domain-containing protein n=1 Tax=Jatrophihabitans sp. TaxID=1932789 RepID=UPI003F7E9389
MSELEVIERFLDEQQLEWQRVSDSAVAVALPGEKRLKTACILTVGTHALEIEAFVMRAPEEHREQVYTYLLQRNTRTYAVSWAVDGVGDIYLVGRLPLSAVTPDELDRVLGAVLEYADGHFNYLLQLGFGSSIKREWAWRVKNNESLANLHAFKEFCGSRELDGVAQRPVEVD